MHKTISIINGWTVVAYSPEICKTYGIPFPTYAAFYACVDEFNPTCEECSFDNLEELVKWCMDN